MTESILSILPQILMLIFALLLITIDIISSAEVLNMINEILSDNIYTNDFVTMFYIVVNMKTGLCNYASAGHHPVLFFDKSKMIVHQLKAKGLFLGAFEKVTFEERKYGIDIKEIFSFIYRWIS